MNFANALSNVNFIAVLVAAAATFVLGGLWYSPFVLGKAWMAENGFTEESMGQGNMAVIFATALVLFLVAATSLAMFLGPETDLATGLSIGLIVGVTYVAAATGVTYLFERKSLKLYLINAGYQVLAFTLMGAMIGAVT